MVNLCPCESVDIFYLLPYYYQCLLFFFFVDRYEAQLEKDWKYIIEDSDSKVLVVATEAIYNKVKDYVGKVSCKLLSLSLLKPRLTALI